MALVIQSSNPTQKDETSPNPAGQSTAIIMRDASTAQQVTIFKGPGMLFSRAYRTGGEQVEKLLNACLEHLPVGPVKSADRVVSTIGDASTRHTQLDQLYHYRQGHCSDSAQKIVSKLKKECWAILSYALG